MWLLPPVTATDGEFLAVTDNMQNYNYHNGIYKLKVIAQVIVLPKTLNIQTLFSISQTIRLHIILLKVGTKFRLIRLPSLSQVNLN